MLIDLGADVNALARKNESPLCCACSRGDIGVVRELLKSNATLDSDSASSAMHEAIKKGDLELVCCPQSINPIQSINQMSPSASRVCASPDIRLQLESPFNKVQLLVETKSNLDLAAPITPLHEAVKANHLHIVEFLIEQCNVRVDEADRPNSGSLSFASSLEMVQLLLRHGADPNAKSSSEPRTALFNSSSVEVTRVLLDARADPNSVGNFGKTRLHVTTSIEQARMLLEARANVNQRSSDLRTPLWHAIQRNDKQMTELLASQPEADLDAVDILGSNLVHVAVSHKNFGCLTPLVRHRADLTFHDSNGWTLLHHVASHYLGYNPAALLCEERRELIELLLDSGIDINAVSSTNDTALYLAVANGNADACRALLAAGADTSIARVCLLSCLLSERVSHSLKCSSVGWTIFSWEDLCQSPSRTPRRFDRCSKPQVRAGLIVMPL